MTPKMAAVAPMPNASVIADTIVKAGPPAQRTERVPGIVDERDHDLLGWFGVGRRNARGGR